MKKDSTKTKEDSTETIAESQAAQSVFAQAANMNTENAINILIQTANVAQKAGVLSVNDAVLVARALELVTNEK